MPNRMIRDGFVDSERVSALSDWAHRCFSNLIVKVDDAGRFDARPEFLRSQLFPLGTKRTTAHVSEALAEMVEQRLAFVYAVGGKPFLQLTTWQRAGNCEQSRYPAPDGSYRIEYVQRDTRDGPKMFVAQSVRDGVAMGSRSDADGIAGHSSTETETKTETYTKTETIPVLSSAVADSIPTPTAGGEKPDEPKPKPAAAIDPDPILVVFPCAGTPSEWGLRSRHANELTALYPAVDVLLEARKAARWIADNPIRKKTARGMPNFIRNWCGREQDRRKPSPDGRPVSSRSDEIRRALGMEGEQ